MLFAPRIRKALQDPGMGVTWTLCRLWPDYYRARLLTRATSCGIARPGFILSFDCDTDRDSAIVETLHSRLRGLGLHPLYAVAGEVLHSAAATYRALAQDGAEFLNHGSRRHAEVVAGSTEIVSTFFYDPDHPEEWEADIRLGHAAVADVTGQLPRGFRTPHFGSFETRGALDRLWQLLAQLGYCYSSSTRPLFAAQYGPVFRRHNIVEIPVSGCLDQPAQIMDSWGLVRGGVGGIERLTRQLEAYLKLMQSGAPILLNVYFDPADIAEERHIIDILGKFAPYEIDGGFAKLASNNNDKPSS